jgi:hypothetical protein
MSARYYRYCGVGSGGLAADLRDLAVVSRCAARVMISGDEERAPPGHGKSKKLQNTVLYDYWGQWYRYGICFDLVRLTEPDMHLLKYSQ